MPTKEDPQAFRTDSATTPEAGNRATVCTAPHNADELGYLAIVGVCLCTTGGNSGTNEVTSPCRDLTNSEVAWPTANDQVNTKYGDLAKQCTFKGKSPVTSQKIEAKLQKLRSHIILHGGAAYMGRFITGDCSSHTGSGVCIKYTGITDSSSEKAAEIKWLAPLKLAAQLLREAEKYDQQTTSLKHQLDALKLEAYGYAQTLSALPRVTAPTTISADTQTSAKTSNEIGGKQKECTAVTKFQECKNKTECKWEGGEAKEGNHCRLNTTVVSEKTTQAGTGAAAHATV
uniref:Variant surface glycoprotein 1125.2926 n=1 Tax=Trypanosoma brucei TaxID=5691 RepID=A0A1J0R940_9TRYP|nr:variant surface glycoprotein 1125.2926 [Trypanosoma brucei]